MLFCIARKKAVVVLYEHLMALCHHRTDPKIWACPNTHTCGLCTCSLEHLSTSWRISSQAGVKNAKCA